MDWPTIREVGTILAEHAADLLIIASSDFSHVQFSGFPSERDVETQVRNKDRRAVDAIQRLDAEDLVKTVHEENVTMCGYGAVAVMLSALEKKASVARLLHYATSYDRAPGDYVVGYAAIVIE
jgi:hypothetical protein